MRRWAVYAVAGVLTFAGEVSCTQKASNSEPAALPGPAATEPGGFTGPLRTATRTGHVSNYDEAKVKPYTLPDPLKMADGRKVTSAAMWFRQRRPEILKLYETEIYGRIPNNTPKVTWESADVAGGTNGNTITRRLTGRIGDKAGGPVMHVTLMLPAAAAGRPVPVILCLNFGFIGGAPRGGRGPAPTTRANASAPAGPGRGRGPVPGGDPVNEILAHGYGYATIVYTDIQPDRANSFNEGVIGLTLPPGKTAPEPDQWGTISAWAWGVSRIVDYFETDKAVDAKQIAIMGHSRLGKTVLWAAAYDPRIAMVYSSCGGELGSSLARRDWGETVDDMAQNYGYQFAGNLQKYPGKWDEMPVDTHMLISLIAPRPVYITGGTTDQWSDPKGEFLAEVAAGPVYRLVGAKDLGVTRLPPLDTPIITGDLGWHYHTGGHMATASDWDAFLAFAGRHFKTPIH